jgi:hypothetical protein
MAVGISTVIVMGMRGVAIRTMRVAVVLDSVAGGTARMRADERDQAGQYGAQERQKDDCLDHNGVSPSSD